MIKEIIILNKTIELFKEMGWEDERISKAMLPELLSIYKAGNAREKIMDRKSNPEEERKKLVKEMRDNYPQPPGLKLCEKCLKWVNSTWAESHRPPYIHCHHKDLSFQKPEKV